MIGNPNITTNAKYSISKAVEFAMHETSNIPTIRELTLALHPNDALPQPGALSTCDASTLIDIATTNPSSTTNQRASHPRTRVLLLTPSPRTTTPSVRLPTHTTTSDSTMSDPNTLESTINKSLHTHLTKHPTSRALRGLLLPPRNNAGTLNEPTLPNNMRMTRQRACQMNAYNESNQHSALANVNHNTILPGESTTLAPSTLTPNNTTPGEQSDTVTSHTAHLALPEEHTPPSNTMPTSTVNNIHTQSSTNRQNISDNTTPGGQSDTAATHTTHLDLG
ncbi:hypothetical protein SARC_02883 [Sphaeroforma arctica JP610]|uniref:Uncharacterized protein n=1 Tax=Sphaeroforma arctica JP610 TaxID=667725 RepID=A0A0L0G7P0_9EUKA|nr:hypothetical protein SARC_02883 [Sphaeroforma arctica JP610]KNC84901.1 hypothetical protein SARC_02883 [Sphaeroforma arctica JP610]|eukprot:XP_014158803.1 hypothetical protein SARC_02883 [Sphaeroforma arctica JP610]